MIAEIKFAVFAIEREPSVVNWVLDICRKKEEILNLKSGTENIPLLDAMYEQLIRRKSNIMTLLPVDQLLFAKYLFELDVTYGFESLYKEVKTINLNAPTESYHAILKVFHDYVSHENPPFAYLINYVALFPQIIIPLISALRESPHSFPQILKPLQTRGLALSPLNIIPIPSFQATLQAGLLPKNFKFAPNYRLNNLPFDAIHGKNQIPLILPPEPIPISAAIIALFKSQKSPHIAAARAVPHDAHDFPDAAPAP